MTFHWIDGFEARARGVCEIEREDSRDRGRVAGNSGGGSARSGSSGAGGSKTSPAPSGLAEARREQAALRRDKSTINAGGKRTESGDTKSAPQKNLPTGVTPLSKPKPTGAVAYYDDPSIGQILGTIGPALVPGGGIVNNAPSIAKGKFDTQNTGGLLGEGIDSLMGQKPGVQTGWSEDPSMTPGRDRAQRGVGPRERFDQTAIGSVTGAASDDDRDAAPKPTKNYSDVELLDRRKPYPKLKQMLEAML